jgi:nitrous oxidase accessory protein
VIRRGVVAGLVIVGSMVPACEARADAGPETQPETRIVSPDGPFRSVAEAVRTAPAWARVVVRAGVYREPPIVVERPLTLVGEGRPRLEATQPASLIRVTADDVTVAGLVLAGVPASHVEDRAAVRFEGVRRCVAQDLEIVAAPYGIYASQTADCRIVGNVVRGAGVGAAATEHRAIGNAIHLWNAQRMTVADNVVTGHRDGLYFEFVQDTTIIRNRSAGNARYGLHFMFSHRCTYRDNRFTGNGAGVAVMYTREVTMAANTFEANRGPTAYGLLLKDISDSTLDDNVLADNTVGLLIEGGGRLAVRRNRFRGNGWAVKLMANSPQNRFEGNVFEGNSFDLATNSRATLAEVRGNWWDRYTGYDLNRDGRGDVPFRPVRLFSLIVASHPPSVVLMRSAFVDLLDAAERALPVLTPETLVDAQPLMARPR